MFAFLSVFFEKNNIDTYAALPLSSCRILRPYLLERSGIDHGSVLMLAVPYLSPDADGERNLSAYAVPRDYHAYFDQLFGELLPLLRATYPQHRFAAFYDHSPIAEVEAASRAGLGCIGNNGLLLTERYSSYVFLAELITDAPLPTTVHSVTHCKGCGICESVCPRKALGECLSAVTQKKGELTPAETEAILSHRTAWGCDLCQEVCPYTVAARRAGSIFSPIPYFREKTIPRLTVRTLEEMSDEEFHSRAYAWRGRGPILRNLRLLEAGPTKEEEEPLC